MTRKLNEFIFERFAPIPKKQWKQKIQFQLNGADYQKTLINTIAEGVNTLPFYTVNDLDKILDYSFTIEPKKTICIEVLDETEANLEAIKYVKKGVNAIYFICFSKNIDALKLVENLEIPVLISCNFLDSNFVDKLKNNINIFILFDPLGKLSATGNWYRSENFDFEKLETLIAQNNSGISINLSLLENAGADYIQQLAYSVCQLKNYVEQLPSLKKKSVTYLVSCSTEIYHEVSKLKALRTVHQIVAKELGFNTNCKILIVKSKRNSRATEHFFNKILLQTEQLIGFVGQADFVCSLSKSNYYTDLDIDKIDDDVIDFLNANFKEQSAVYSNSLFIEKLTQQFVEKTLELIKSIAQGHGYLVQFKKGIIQQKIFEKALKQQKLYNEHFKNSATAQFLENKKAIQYPFFKYEEKKTQYKPIVQKRLHAPLEKPLWDQFFSNE